MMDLAGWVITESPENGVLSGRENSAREGPSGLYGAATAFRIRSIEAILLSPLSVQPRRPWPRSAMSG